MLGKTSETTLYQF